MRAMQGSLPDFLIRGPLFFYLGMGALGSASGWGGGKRLGFEGRRSRVVGTNLFVLRTGRFAFRILPSAADWEKGRPWDPGAFRRLGQKRENWSRACGLPFFFVVFFLFLFFRSRGRWLGAFVVCKPHEFGGPGLQVGWGMEGESPGGGARQLARAHFGFHHTATLGTA